MNYRFEPKHSFMIDANSTVAHIYGRSRGNVEITESRIRKYFHEELKSGIEAKRLCCGHDCVRVLGRGLRKAFGSTSPV